MLFANNWGCVEVKVVSKLFKHVGLDAIPTSAIFELQSSTLVQKMHNLQYSWAIERRRAISVVLGRPDAFS
jgi:hypothetical protein